LGRRRSQEPSGPRPNDNWIYETKIQIHGRNVEPGTELKIVGERGRFRFVRRVTNHKGVSWLDVWGGPKGAECMRSFYEIRVKRVHYKNQTVGNLAKEYKDKKSKKKKATNDQI
jgi:hypothetical protein